MQDDLRISCNILICQLASLIFDELLTMSVVRVELMAPSHMGKEEVELLLYSTQQLDHVTC
jgi:hypothetical protein